MVAELRGETTSAPVFSTTNKEIIESRSLDYRDGTWKLLPSKETGDAVHEDVFSNGN